MKKGGIKVLYICSHKDLGGASQSMLDMVDSLSGIIEPIILTTQEGELSQECKRRGYECLIKRFTDLACLPSQTIGEIIRRPWRSPLVKYFLWDIRCLLFLCQHLDKDIEIVHSNVSGCTIGILISKLWHVPHVWHIREAIDIHFNPNICLGTNRLNKLINKADARIAISSAIKDHFKMPDKGTFVINDAVRSKNEITYVHDKDKYFLFAAFGISEAKGVSVVVKAFSLSQLDKDGYRLKIIGHCDSMMRNHLESIAKEYGCADNLDFIPFQRQIKSYFEHATAFIQGSVFEGLGRTTAEALFYGCPVIATSYSGGTLDIIHNKETGYLFESAEQCAELMREVASNDQTELIKNAQIIALEKLTHEAFGPKLIEVYNYVTNHYAV